MHAAVQLAMYVGDDSVEIRFGWYLRLVPTPELIPARPAAHCLRGSAASIIPDQVVEIRRLQLAVNHDDLPPTSGHS
jgi:hypothetical protein